MNNKMDDRIQSYKGNEYKIRDIHNRLLCLLDEFDKYCRERNISYSLAYGSLLGCVRSHGFIPWDDDVDVMMSRSDFNKFIDSMTNSEEQLSKDCQLICPSFLNKIYKTYGDGMSIFIDIYPIDNVPDNKWLEKYKLYLIQSLRQIIIGRNSRNKTLFRRYTRKAIAYFFSFPFSKSQLRKIYQLACSWGNDMVTSRVCCYCTTNKSYGRYHSADEITEIEYVDFEDIKMPIIAKYDSYLTREYGKEYMTPPKEKDRHPDHLNFKK